MKNCDWLIQNTMLFRMVIAFLPIRPQPVSISMSTANAIAVTVMAMARLS